MPRLGGSTRDNRCVSLIESQFLEIQSRTCKTFSTLARLKNGIPTQPIRRTKLNRISLTPKKLLKIRQSSVCNETYPLPKKIFIYIHNQS